MGFCFTYTKLKGYEKCPRQHKAVDIDRTPGWEPQGDAIDYGNRVHKALHNTLGKGQPLPVIMKGLQYWVDWCNKMPGDHYVEQKWALDRHYQPTEYFGGQQWLRFNADFAAVHGTVGWLVDWKTGGRLEEPLQLWLGAGVMFGQFPALRRIISMFVWLKEDDGLKPEECISTEEIRQEELGEIWESLLPRIQTYEGAVELANGHKGDHAAFPPRPGIHCRWCRVQSCEYWGKPP
jgi:hypothetical protein